jgi:hypothetical protein
VLVGAHSGGCVVVLVGAPSGQASGKLKFPNDILVFLFLYILFFNFNFNLYFSLCSQAMGTDVVLARTCCHVGVGGCSFGRLCFRVGGCSFKQADQASSKLKIHLKIPTDILDFFLIFIFLI